MKPCADTAEKSIWHPCSKLLASYSKCACDDPGDNHMAFDNKLRIRWYTVNLFLSVSGICLGENQLLGESKWSSSDTYIYIYIVKFPSSLQSLSRWLLPIIDPPLKHFGSGQPLGVGSGGILCLRPFGKARLPFISGQGPYSKRISRCWPSRADWWLWSCILGKECSGVLQILLPFTVQYIYIYISFFVSICPFP